MLVDSIGRLDGTPQGAWEGYNQKKGRLRWRRWSPIGDMVECQWCRLSFRGEQGGLSRLQNCVWVRWTYTYIGRWFWCCICFSFWVDQADLIILFNSANFVKCRHPTQWVCCKSAHCSYIFKNKGGEESIFPMMSSDLLQYEKKWKRDCKWRAEKRNCKGKQEQLTHKGCDVYLRSIFVVERYSYDTEPSQWISN